MNYLNGSNKQTSVTPATPLPVQTGYGAARSTMVSGTVSATSNSAVFTPDLGREIWLQLTGTGFTGSVQLMRSIDGGTNWLPVTRGDGVVKGVWTTDLNAIVQLETSKLATYRLAITVSAGSVAYKLYQ